MTDLASSETLAVSSRPLDDGWIRSLLRRDISDLRQLSILLIPGSLALQDKGSGPLVALLSAGACGALLFTLARQLRAQLVIPLPVIAVVTWFAMTILWTTDRGSTTRRFLLFLTLGFAGWTAITSVDYETFIERLALACKILTGWTWLLLLVAWEWSTRPRLDNAPGWHGPFLHKNALGVFCWISIATFLSAKKISWFWIAAAFGLVVGSSSSTGLACTIAVIVAALTMALFRRFGGVGRLSIVLVAATWAVLLAAFVGVANITTSLSGNDESFTGRDRVWDAVRSAVTERPWTGYGFGAAWSAGDDTNIVKQLTVDAGFRAYSAHNLRLEVLSQVGLIGALLLLVALGSAAFHYWKWPHRRERVNQWPALLIVGGFPGVLVESFPLTHSGFPLLIAMLCLPAQRVIAERRIDRERSFRSTQQTLRTR
jgi:exopolysaccharide production protein ExoQ